MSQLLAYCGSYKCTNILSSRLTKKDYVVKDVKNTNTCPDCGCALMWRKAGANQTTKDLKTRKKLFSVHEKFSSVG